MGLAVSCSIRIVQAPERWLNMRGRRESVGVLPYVATARLRGKRARGAASPHVRDP